MYSVNVITFFFSMLGNKFETYNLVLYSLEFSKFLWGRNLDSPVPMSCKILKTTQVFFKRYNIIQVHLNFQGVLSINSCINQKSSLTILSLNFMYNFSLTYLRNTDITQQQLKLNCLLVWMFKFILHINSSKKLEKKKYGVEEALESFRRYQ